MFAYYWIVLYRVIHKSVLLYCISCSISTNPYMCQLTYVIFEIRFFDSALLI